MASNRFGRAGRRRSVLLIALLVGAVVGSAALPGRAADSDSGAYVTWIESRAGRVFERDTPQLRGQQATYRVDARVLLPLGFTSMELWNEEGVGTAVASFRDCASESGDVVRAFELFAASEPERAHGFDRRGFFREALRVTPSGIAWTAYFGAMTSWPEKTLSDAKKAANGPQPHTYEAIDGISSPLDSRAALFQLSTEGKLHDPEELWCALRPQLSSLKARSNLVLAGTPAKPLPALAFLGALQTSLRSAAVHRGKPLPAAATRVRFTHNGIVRQLELSSMSPDAARGRRAVASGVARNAGDVFELRYRILNPGFEDGEFRLWVELPATVQEDLLSPPLAPLGWELQLRSYLKLVFQRINPGE